MNILFLHRVWPSYGGGETVTKCLANEMIRRGHHVYVLYFKDSANVKDSIECNNAIMATKLKDVAFDENSKEFFINKKLARKVSKELIDFVKANYIEVIINQWWPIEFHQGVREKTNAKIVRCLHMDPNTKKIYEFTGMKKWCFEFIEPLYRKVESIKHLYSSDKYLRNVDKYIFLAPSFLNYYRETSKEEDRIRKTDFVYNPLVFENFITKEEYEKKEKRVLFVGRLVEGHKKVSRILNIWKRYETEHPDGQWSLDIVGDGPDRGRYEDFVKNQNLQRVSFYGFQDPTPYYKRASIFLMTSAYEGWPMTIVESMQNQVACICMKTFLSVSDVIESGVNGILVSDGDEDVMYREMIGLMDNPDIRKKLVENGLESCKRYSVDKIVDKWEEVFEDLKFLEN